MMPNNSHLNDMKNEDKKEILKIVSNLMDHIKDTNKATNRRDTIMVLYFPEENDKLLLRGELFTNMTKKDVITSILCLGKESEELVFLSIFTSQALQP